MPLAVALNKQRFHNGTMNKIVIVLIPLFLCGCTSVHVELEQQMPVRKVKLDVPFAPQAPFANWDAPYQEACEEMSLIMVHHFLQGSDLNMEQADKEILGLVSWQEDNGYSEDVTLAELQVIAKEYYGYESIILENPTDRELKEQIMKGNPVIVPAAGRMLGNKYYSGEGPWYHMLVITGYTSRSFVTNDPGTKRGKKFSYKIPVLMNAIHDWTGVKENIAQGASRVLVLVQPSS